MNEYHKYMASEIDLRFEMRIDECIFYCLISKQFRNYEDFEYNNINVTIR